VLNDQAISVLIDGTVAGGGSFVKGFVLPIYTDEGTHKLPLNPLSGIRIPLFVMINTQKNKKYRIDLTHGRGWGNFKMSYSEANEQIVSWYVFMSGKEHLGGECRSYCASSLMHNSVPGVQWLMALMRGSRWGWCVLRSSPARKSQRDWENHAIRWGDELIFALIGD